MVPGAGVGLKVVPKLPKSIRSFKSGRRKRRRSDVVPLGPSISSRRGSVSIGSFLSFSKLRLFADDDNTPILTFREAFGVLGPFLVLMVLGCSTWTLWLIILSVAPNTVANWLMNTSQLDDGQFWLIPDEWSTLQIFSVTGLAVVLIFYFYVLLKMLVWRSQKNALQNKLDTIFVYWEAMGSAENSQHMWIQRACSSSWMVYQQWKTFTNIHGKNRKFWNLCLKLHDLVMLSLLLRDLLEAGTPVRIAYGFSVMASLNALSCAISILFPRGTALFEILLDTLFDFAATVIYPLTVLYYCSKNFHFDRAVFAINMELLPIGSFERRARMYANPAEIALVRSSFDSLRIQDRIDFFLRIGMNLAFSYRCKRIVEVLIEIKCRDHRREGPKKSIQQQPIYFSSSRLQNIIQRPVPKSAAIPFIAYSIGIFVVTREAITTSQDVCSKYPQCVVFAYRWRNTNYCPCRALVDGNPAPRTYYEWTHPVDATETVKALSSAGTLETLQLVNRQFTVFPEEIRGCHHLNLISLINCGTEELPRWAKEFHDLQYLQVEGKIGSNNLDDLAVDLFSDMPELRYLQLGIHPRMLRFPPLEGAPNLKSIIFSRLYNLVEFPPLTHQPRLERLEFGACKHLPYLPDLHYVVSLARFAIFQGGYLCCNGFRGTCNLTDPYCQRTTCLKNTSLLATPATLQVFTEFSDGVCQPNTVLSQVPTPETIQMCEGIPFRECQIPGLQLNTTVTGMCYNHRMQALACNPDPDKIKVRRRQIQEHVGIPCDPEVEAWLGCTNNSK
ncbi:hypothetical protein PHMEG_00025655 [Phytophthora megakarya]|uniref:WLGC domain-containing protein n=1 Tax=Phytophthora megakarya TaxID=4795 RepID=A0A225VBJ7_9STRA|nr:hypothetical protein PHMEG_00025655 [Phytophthora megakarya]